MAAESSTTSLDTLPSELHLLIASYLTYPDALSLKHTNRHFYTLVHTGLSLKIEWLIERRRLHLDCPHDRGCELGSDMKFCRGSVRLLMKRRREHGECDIREGGRGCLVFGTKVCTYRKKEVSRAGQIRSFVSQYVGEVGAMLWWAVLALVGIGLAWGWRERRVLGEAAMVVIGGGGGGGDSGSRRS